MTKLIWVIIDMKCLCYKFIYKLNSQMDLNNLVQSQVIHSKIAYTKARNWKGYSQKVTMVCYAKYGNFY